MKFKHLTVVGIAALALAACGGSPAAENPTAASGATSQATGATAAPASTAATTTNGDPSAVVARLGDITLTRGELDGRIKRIQDGIKASGNPQAPADLDIEKSLVDLFLNEVLALNIATQRNVAVTDADVDAQIELIGKNISSQGGTLQEAITSQLGFENDKEPGFRQLISSIVVRQRISSTLVTTDTVESTLRAEVEKTGKEEVKKADVRHILVATEDEAKKVIERLNGGEKFEDLAKELSTDPGSKDNGGLYEGVEPGQFVPEFDKAMFEDLKPGETTQTPVKTDYGYHIIRLEKLTTGPRYTAEQVEQQVQQQLPSAVQQQQAEAFQKLIDEAREKAKADGTLVEPNYPEPTPAVPGALPDNVAPAETSVPAETAPTTAP